MDSSELERRTKVFALGVIRFVAAMHPSKFTDVLSYQLLKSATAVGAIYREANRAESHNDFIHKIGLVEKEASETHYWLELCVDAGIGGEQDRGKLLAECSELLAIFTASGRTAKSRRNR